jgi:uncharacterized protein
MASKKRGRKNMPLILSLGIILLIAAGIWTYIFFFQRMNPPLPADTLTVDGATFKVEIASTRVEQARGLSFRPSLGANAGMLFVFRSSSVQSFWMKDMNFPLDMIWIAGNEVVGFAQDAVPQPGAQLWQLAIYTSPDGTDKVLEVNAGTVAKYNIKVGDQVAISGNAAL